MDLAFSNSIEYQECCFNKSAVSTDKLNGGFDLNEEEVLGTWHLLEQRFDDILSECLDFFRTLCNEDVLHQ